ncbi:MAG TPA: hypothetical protein VHM67_09640, partial [Gemmatimonadaceae bacterium]|nr:hypothetical protein [Gemmatimonadaceae bacterium]
MPDNPFVIGGTVSGDYFTNRAPERRRIAAALTQPQNHLLLFGPRRMGKTSTLRVVADDLAARGKRVVMADLSTASTLSDATNRLLQAATRSLGRRWKDTATALVQRLKVRVGLEPDAASGMLLPSVDVSLRDSGLETQRAAFGEALDAIEGLAATKGAHVGVILDEFQEIHRFGGEVAEAHLRSTIQDHRHASYVLAGSDARLIRAMTGARRPLYKLLEPMPFGPIDSAHLATWIDDRLTATGVRARGVGELIIALAGPRTRDVVQLARATFELGRSARAATEATIADAFLQVVLGEDAPTRALWERFSPLQQNVLRAVATRSTGLTTRATRTRFGLGDTGPATKAATTLVSRDVLVKSGPAYHFDSPFTRGWVILNTLADVGVSLPVTHLPDS